MHVWIGMDAAGSKRIIDTGGSGIEWNQDSISPFIR